MIVKTAKGWKVVSEKGKPLSRDDLSRVEAEERLKEVERFKKQEKDVKGLKQWASTQKDK